MTTQHSAEIWKAVLGELQLQVTRPSYETWLKDTIGVAHNDSEFVVGTPNAFVAEMLEQRMYSLISQAVERVTRGQVEVRFEVAASEAHIIDTDTNSHVEVRSANGSSNGNGHAEVHQNVTPLFQNGTSAQTTHRTVTLNPKYTFDTFVVGKSNELAHAASDAVSKKPGLVYNPLVLYSDVGLGKTHLLHAIGHRILTNGMTLIYATTEQFTNEYIKAIRQGTTEDFRDYYRSADLLLLDDIQFLIGKEQTQEGFFHTFNALHMTNRQIVITSDRPVASLALLEDRIRSRLSGGLVVDVQPPDLETRLAILRAKAELLQLNLNDEILTLIGERTFKNIRELEGSLNRVVAYAQLVDSPITPELVRRVTSDMVDSDRSKQVSEELVLDSVSRHFGVDKESIKGRKRDKKTAQARQVTMYLLREEANLGATAIGRVLGGKDHTTVLHGCKTIENQLNVDAALRRDVIKIRETLSES